MRTQIPTSPRRRPRDRSPSRDSGKRSRYDGASGLFESCVFFLGLFGPKRVRIRDELTDIINQHGGHIVSRPNDSSITHVLINLSSSIPANRVQLLDADFNPNVTITMKQFLLNQYSRLVEGSDRGCPSRVRNRRVVLDYEWLYACLKGNMLLESNHGFDGKEIKGYLPGPHSTPQKACDAYPHLAALIKGNFVPQRQAKDRSTENAGVAAPSSRPASATPTSESSMDWSTTVDGRAGLMDLVDQLTAVSPCAPSPTQSEEPIDGIQGFPGVAPVSHLPTRKAFDPRLRPIEPYPPILAAAPNTIQSLNPPSGPRNTRVFCPRSPANYTPTADECNAVREQGDPHPAKVEERSPPPSALQAPAQNEYPKAPIKDGAEQGHPTPPPTDSARWSPDASEVLTPQPSPSVVSPVVCVPHTLPDPKGIFTWTLGVSRSPISFHVVGDSGGNTSLEMLITLGSGVIEKIERAMIIVVPVPGGAGLNSEQTAVRQGLGSAQQVVSQCWVHACLIVGSMVDTLPYRL